MERRRMLQPTRFLSELPDGLYDELRIKRSYGW
jgi:DNA helicase II / ATP-dependent DNA helicase PcrA